ncbi:MAG: prefoldin subunit alpha [Candidatus Woesearchaeota archaeon]|jgi:prefoldin alpha subunit|nr:prefoldin subunit alpha [Candidatus Woesearchaeota archaeon]MDP7324462.1 prefoldin subunit alpha [Candidatus Woesearchaeota archaeon]MDP7458473.1 prefoldin subunit alpha [Candidatus Woesearchaeota archaeon]
MAKDKPDKGIEKQMKEGYVEYQMVTQQVKQVQEQIESIQEQLTDLNSVTENLDHLKEAKKEDEMLIPVANGIFFKTALKDNSEFLVNVGSNTVVAKSFPQVKDMLTVQKKELEEVHDNLVIQFQKLHEQSAKLEQDLKNLVSQSENV